jgi:hypothetical protein
MAVSILGSLDVFTTAHIAFTAAVTGVIVFAVALLLLGRREALLEGAVVGLLAAAAVFLWRRSANMPQLNRDGLHGFSANDWLAPVMVYVVLGVYELLARARGERRFGQVRALAFLVALVVNVVTI